MQKPENRKLFSAERRKTGAASAPENYTEQGGSAFKAHKKAATAAPQMGGEIMAMLQEIRKDIRAIQFSAASGAAADGAPGAPAIDPLDTPESRAVRIEIAQMVKTIGRAKQELAAIRHPMKEDDRIQKATSELDAIVMATESATNGILNAAEGIEKETINIAALAHENEELLEINDRIVDFATQIMEECNFQDITGQRITKVVRTMRFIEERILAMIDIWGVHAFTELSVEEVTDASDQDAALLNGPQLANQGISQDDIDAMFD